MRPIEIQPYSVRGTITGHVPRLREFVANLLTEVARRCQHKESLFVGHIKCYAVTDAGSVHGSLTSLKIGAQCSTLVPAKEPHHGRVDIDLAVLLYGFEWEALDSITRTSLESVCRTQGVTWELGARSS